MEFSVQTGICSNCKGVNKCTRGCVLHLGKALVDFIQRVDVTETRIGEYSSRKAGTKPDLVVSGHQIYANSESPTWVLTDISTVLGMSDKFKNAYDKNAFQIASNYCKYAGISAEETKEITDKLKAINKNKLLVLPFKPGNNCEVDIEIGDALEKKKEATISYIKWTTDKETHKIKCTIGFNIDGSSIVQNTTLDIKNYIDRFRLSQMEMTAKGAKHDKNLIKVSDSGIFKPIIVREGNIDIAVDATYVYYSTNLDTRIIGFWNDKGDLIIDKNITGKAVTKIKDNVNYIRNHRKYMAPYMLFEPNIIEIE